VREITAEGDGGGQERAKENEGSDEEGTTGSGTIWLRRSSAAAAARASRATNGVNVAAAERRGWRAIGRPARARGC